MAIKVKHEGNVTSRITAASAGGQGKRAADDGKAWAQIAAGEAQAANRQLQGAHASPVSPGHASAQLTHAPTGAAPGIMHAPSGGVHGGGGAGGGLSGRSLSGAGAGAGDSSRRRYKVTGDKFFNKPDKESVWDWDSRQWIREYLPGEWEAEAQQRIGDVKNSQELEILDARHKQEMERAEQDSLLGRERDILGAKLKSPPKPSENKKPPIQSPFPNAPEKKPPEQPAPPPVPPKRGWVTITPSNPTAAGLRYAMPDEQTGTSPAELYNTLDKIDPRLIDIREQFKNGGIQEPFDNAMSVALATLSSDGMSGGITPSDLGRGGNGTVGELFDAIRAQQGSTSPVASPMPTRDELASVYGSGGSIYERGGESGVKPLSWLRSPDMDVAAGGDSAAANAYADGMEGMINALMRRV